MPGYFFPSPKDTATPFVLDNVPLVWHIYSIMIKTTTESIEIEKIIKQIKKEIELTNINKPFQTSSARMILKSFDSSINKVNKWCHISKDKSLIITKNTLMAAFPVVLECRHKPNQPLRAAKLLIDIWIEQANHCITQKERLAVFKNLIRKYPLSSPGTITGSLNYKEDEQLRNIYIMSLYEHTTDTINETSKIIKKLRAALGLSQDELGKVFKVTGETIRRWELGNVSIPKAKLATLISAEAALSRLLSIFTLDRLPTVIRRTAEIFEGQCALDWIFHGRFDDVANQYDLLTTYQL